MLTLGLEALVTAGLSSSAGPGGKYHETRKKMPLSRGKLVTTASWFADRVPFLASGRVLPMIPQVARPITDTDDVTLRLIQRDGYLAADARDLQWRFPDWGAYDLSTLRTTFLICDDDGQCLLETSPTPLAGDWIAVELTSEQTDLRSGRYLYRLQAELAGGDVVTLVLGTLEVSLSFAPD
jgi:hypothetical protein